MKIHDDKPLTFSRHVLVRMVQRGITPNDVFRTLQDVNPEELGSHKFTRTVGRQELHVVVVESQRSRTVQSAYFDGQDGSREW